MEEERSFCPMPRIAVIDNAIDPGVYRPVRHWSRWLTGDWVSFEARNDRLPSLDDGFSHILLTGSEASILERAPWAEAEVSLVRDALDRGLPILGSCYGHQLLALAIGGPRYVRRCRKPEIGWLPIRVLGNDPLLGPARTAYAFSLHFDEVVDPDGLLTVLADTPICPLHAFRFGARPIWGVQSHPEIGPDDGRELLETELERGYAGGPLIERALHSVPRDDGLVRSVVTAFLQA
jgi:GMP synthase-like glutamine amidotransferase